MASTRHSPVVVEQSSPPHTFSSPDFALSILSPSLSNQRTPDPSTSSAMSTTETHAEPDSVPTAETSLQTDINEQATDSVTTHTNDDGDDSSHSDSASDSSTSTETPRTASTPRSAEPDTGEHTSGSQTDHPSSVSVGEQTGQDSILDSATINGTQPSDSASPAEAFEPPIPPVQNNPPPPMVEDIPEWVRYEEDTSEPNEEELKEIESNKNELDASNYAAVEKDVFADINDPDLRPHKKIRLSWIVKGVRGTKEKPNRVRIMTSPAVQVDGMYWNIKFFPRGNKSRNSLSAYLRCSSIPPEPSKSHYEGTFKCFECAADAEFSTCEPLLNLDLAPPEVKSDVSLPTEDAGTEEKKQSEGCEELQAQDETQVEDDDSVSADENATSEKTVKISTNDDFRVSAQLGLVIYNPAEPRTCFTSSASHQFYPHQDDWGWDTAVSHWEDIHRRKRGQRQALLRDDTLAIDAYIRIYDDPTKALFWHSSPGESQWDSKGLAGFFPFGTRMLYHSPATAGIASWLLLAPFRNLIQRIHAGSWRKDSASRPRPLIAQLQLVLFQMRYMKKEELYIHIDSVIHEITRCQESFDSVTTFWEAFRRSIELEVSEDSSIGEALFQMFGHRDMGRKLPLLPVQKIANFQEGIDQAFSKAGFKDSLPDFLPLTLQRQSFDSVKREWCLHRDRVGISEEIDMSHFCTDEDSKFTLYGLVVHESERTSGKFHSILRPAGPGGKWLAFTDGNGNKVKSYTKKQVDEYEIPDDSAVKKSNEAPRMFSMALYIRTSKLSHYLPKELEPFHLAAWLKPYLDESYYHNPDLFEPSEPVEKSSPVQIELFWDKLVDGQEGKLDLYRLKSTEKAHLKNFHQILTADRDSTILNLKTKIASVLGIPDKAFKIWSMNYYRLGAVSKAYMYVLSNDSIIGSCLASNHVLNLWLSTFPDKYELADNVLTENFLRLGGTHIEIPARQEAEKTPERASDPPTASSAESQSSTPPGVNTARNEAPHTDTANGEASNQDIRTLGTAETVNNTEASNPQAQSDSTRSNDRVPEGAVAAPDAEEASVQQAAQQSLQDLQSEPRGRESDILPTDIPNRSVPASPTDINTSVQPRASNGTGESMNLGTVSSSSIAGLDLSVQAQVTVGTMLNSQSDVADPNLAAESANRVPGIDSSLAFNDPLPPVVHGHLFEAASHDNGSLPLGIPITIGNDQIILMPPNHGDLSAEDAALISQMIAADLEASDQRVTNGNVQDDDGESAVEDEELDSRPSTPRPAVADIYGFIHVFDAVNQKFTARGTFNVPRDTVISTMIKRQLNFDESHAFQLWKRDGTFRTTGVSLESTFMDVALADCCEVIVGDHIGEVKIESLKSEAKFVDPGQLMRHIAMVQRKHPILATTTQGSVELAEFGGDYYKGPLVNGQRHGKLCSVITQSGDSYEGPLLSGQKSGGKGKMVYQNGDIYDGEWLDDQKHGQGEFVEKRTGNRYVGGYENDKRWGKGVTYWEMADQQAALCQVCYFEEVDAVFYKCGHVVACFTCAKQCASDSAGCPVCRKPVEAVVKMYRS